jgi:hypothetical protein
MATQLPTARRDLIAQELSELGVRADDRFGLFDSLVEACYRVLTQNPHENRLRSTGVAILSHHYDKYEFREGRWLEVDGEICWALADGVNSFVTMIGDKVFLLVLERLTPWDELSLFSLREEILYGADREYGPRNRPERECWLVKRAEGHSNRKVTILAGNKIVNVSGLSYVEKPYQYEILGQLREQIDPYPWTREYDQTIKSALRLAIHKLSPENFGAILVILAPSDMSEGEINVRQRMILDNSTTPTGFSIVRAAHQRPLLHLASQRDGAIIISANGDVLHVGVFFRTVGSEGSQVHEGTRHRSAREFSREIEGMVIVVSSDGPVTAFRKGERLVSTARAGS